jgi:hypothetical protein
MNKAADDLVGPIVAQEKLPINLNGPIQCDRHCLSFALVVQFKVIVMVNNGLDPFEVIGSLFHE